MASNEQMRSEFEAHYAPHQLQRDTNGYYAGQYIASSVEREWVIFKCGWQAALSSLPRMTEEEIAAVFREADFETAAEGGHSNDIYPKAARALIAKLPHIVKE